MNERRVKERIMESRSVGCGGNRGVCVVFAVLVWMLAASPLPAAQTLMISPARIIFTGKTRAVQANITNPSEKAVRYSVDVVPQRRGADGQWRLPAGALTDTEKELKKMIRFAPRRATVKARSGQAVKFMLRKSGDLPPGEYRYFLRITPHEPEFKKRSALETAGEGSGEEGLSMNLRMIVTANFPLIVFHDVPLAKVEAESLELKADKEAKSGFAAVVRVRRSGEVSSFGNISLSYLAPGASPAEKRRVGWITGEAIYSPQTGDTLSLPLNGITPQELRSGTLLFEYYPAPGYRKKEAQTTRRFPLG